MNNQYTFLVWAGLNLNQESSRNILSSGDKRLRGNNLTTEKKIKTTTDI